MNATLIVARAAMHIRDDAEAHDVLMHKYNEVWSPRDWEQMVSSRLAQTRYNPLDSSSIEETDIVRGS